MTETPAEYKVTRGPSTLEKALQIALEAHRGQTDKGGKALHPPPSTLDVTAIG